MSITSVAVEMLPMVADEPHARLRELLASLAEETDTYLMRMGLCELIATMRVHFMEEEEIMDNIYYPQREAHVRSHTRLLDAAEKLLMDVTGHEDARDLVRRLICEPVEHHTHKYDSPMLLAACAIY